MAISKKNSRPLNCNGKRFRWAICPAKYFLKFVAEGQENSGRKIEVLVESDIDRFWVEFPNVSDLNLKVITPKDAASFILHALGDGWDPVEKGSAIKYQLTSDGLSRA